MFISLVALIAATMSFAQNTLVATLSHGDEIKMFYGAYALRDAHNAAANGDIINLSSGSFQSVKITKALTIRGTGYDDPVHTTIVGNFWIEIPDTVTDRLSFEGCHIPNNIYVYGTLSNAYFLKNVIQGIYGGKINYTSNTNIINGTFVNCRVYGMELIGNSTVQFLNCEVASFSNNSEHTAAAAFINCNIRPKDGYYAGGIRSSQLINCFIYNDVDNNNFDGFPATSSAYNCVAIGPNSGNIFNNMAVKQNCQTADFDIFQEGNPWNDLTDEAKVKYIGTDGTPIGYYGGMMPFDLTPTYPQITKMNVASKTTADGKLSVEIEVSAAE